MEPPVKRKSAVNIMIAMNSGASQVLRTPTMSLKNCTRASHDGRMVRRNPAPTAPLQLWRRSTHHVQGATDLLIGECRGFAREHGRPAVEASDADSNCIANIRPRRIKLLSSRIHERYGTSGARLQDDGNRLRIEGATCGFLRSTPAMDVRRITPDIRV